VSIASPNVPRTSGSVVGQNGAATQEGPIQRWVAAAFGRRSFWVFFVLLGFVVPLSHVLRAKPPEKLPVLGSIGPFELVDQLGSSFGTADLEQRVWVVSAIRSTTPSATDLAETLGKVQHRARNLGNAFHIVTVGIDPENDAPDDLAEFAHHHRVSPRIWSFLSGEPEALRRAQSALGLVKANAAKSGATTDGTPRDGTITAAAGGSALALTGPLSVALVDGKMRVRGRYDLGEPGAIDKLLYHVGLLVNRGD
jgi:cytochrome oxidase Cu insertion factor (SCO1/SenC/PrrC family)